MDYLLTGIVFFVMFSILVLIHEFGHFYMAKRAGIKVEEFGFGLPPRIWGKKKGETLYSINAIPFGGFVRMFGDDSSDPKYLKSKRSFVGKSVGARFKVLIAGVVMNFFLAWLLLSIALTVGMEPIITPDGMLNAVADGTIPVSQGIVLRELNEDLVTAGFVIGDVLYEYNGNTTSDYNFSDFMEEPVGNYKVIRNGDVVELEIIANTNSKENVWTNVKFDAYFMLPRVKVVNVTEDSIFYESGLRNDDVILSINDQPILQIHNKRNDGVLDEFQSYDDIVSAGGELDYIVYRDGVEKHITVNLEDMSRVMIDAVIDDMPAKDVGLIPGDIIVSINGDRFLKSIDLIKFVANEVIENPKKPLTYVVDRNGLEKSFEISPVDGKIGVYLSNIISYGDFNISLRESSVLTTIGEIPKEKYPFYIAMYKSFGENVKLGKMTAGMFVDVVRDLISSGNVPDEVAGPVGIFQMTHIFAHEGVIAILRFMALLSLSLAVINILPFPALDGGRLVFVLIEFFTGKKVNQKVEMIIHGIGYVLILLMILLVTYSDIMRLFN